MEMGDTLGARFWCYRCSQRVNPITEVEIKCPFCDSGFVEEMDGRADIDDVDLGSDRALSLWAPILLGMMSGSSRRRRLRRAEEDDELDQDRDFESIIRRRRRSSAAIVQLLQSLRSSEQNNSSTGDGGRDRQGQRERERVILINPFNQAIILQGSFDMNESQNYNTDAPAPGSGASLGDYFVGPGLDLLLQHLAENDPNRYGTPPARKEAVEALPTVEVAENLQCSVCLEDFDIGTEAKEMPCKHKFHGGCILPWLELHSSCPVCRFQLPADDGPKDLSASSNGNRVGSNEGGDGDERSGGNGRRFWVPVPWPFNGLFSSAGTQGNGNSSSTSSSSSSASGNNSHSDEN